MGVSTNVYCVFGVMKPYPDGFMDAFEEIYDKPEYLNSGFHVITDGMSGEYVVVGITVFDSGDFRWGEFTEERRVTPLGDLVGREQDVKDRFRALLPDYADWMDEPFQLVSFIHYS